MIPQGFSSAVSSLPLWSVALEGSSKEISKGLFICWGLHRTVLNRQWVRATKWHFALESLMVMNKNKRRITSLHRRNPRGHFRRAGVHNSALCRRLQDSMKSAPGAFRLAHAQTAVLGPVGCVPVQQGPGPELLLHPLLIAFSSVTCVGDSRTGRKSSSFL